MPTFKSEFDTRKGYIGDGVYAEFDGSGVWLTTDRHYGEKITTDKIYLEVSVFNSLYEYFKRCTGKE